MEWDNLALNLAIGCDGSRQGNAPLSMIHTSLRVEAKIFLIHHFSSSDTAVRLGACESYATSFRILRAESRHEDGHSTASRRLWSSGLQRRNGINSAGVSAGIIQAHVSRETSKARRQICYSQKDMSWYNMTPSRRVMGTLELRRGRPISNAGTTL